MANAVAPTLASWALSGQTPSSFQLTPFQPRAGDVSGPGMNILDQGHPYSGLPGVAYQGGGGFQLPYGYDPTTGGYMPTGGGGGGGIGGGFGLGTGHPIWKMLQEQQAAIQALQNYQPQQSVMPFMMGSHLEADEGGGYGSF